MDPNRFHVVTCISNACRYQSRVRLYKEFAAHMKESGVQLWTVEAAFGDRPFEVTEVGNPRHIQLRTRTELWHKENMLNIGIGRLPHDFEVVCWIDADIRFARMTPVLASTGHHAGQVTVADWAMETWHQLQHHNVCQLWSTGIDMGPKTQSMTVARSFAWSLLDSKMPEPTVGYGGYWHSGYAWAMHRRAVDKMRDPRLLTAGGPLLDYAPLGSSDFYMAWGLLDQLTPRVYQDVHDKKAKKQGFHPAYVKHLLLWQEVAQKLHKDIGVVEGTILHSWHGKKKQRQYNSRENILIRAQFNPETDIMRDHQGLWMWSPAASEELRDDLRRYSRMRDEDSNDM